MEQQVKQVKYEIDNYKLSNLQFMHMNAQKKVHWLAWSLKFICFGEGFLDHSDQRITDLLLQLKERLFQLLQ